MTLTEQLAKARAEFIDSRQENLSAVGKRLQELLLEAIIKKLVDNLQTSKGKITDRTRNINLSAAIEKIFKAFSENEYKNFATQFASDIQTISALNIQYFGSISQENQRAFQQTADTVANTMEARLGLKPNGELIPNGFLDSFIGDTTLKTDIRSTVYNAVTRQVSISDLSALLRTKLLGTIDFRGPIVSKFNQFIFDTYQQHDRATSKTFAQKLDLTYLLYAGGLIDTSRAFCEKRNGKVFTIDETKTWVDDPDLPKTKEERSSGIILYDPLIDCGRFRCRHHVNYLPEILAIKLRPELAK